MRMAGDVLLSAWGGYRTCPIYLLKMYSKTWLSKASTNLGSTARIFTIRCSPGACQSINLLHERIHSDLATVICHITATLNTSTHLAVGRITLLGSSYIKCNMGRDQNYTSRHRGYFRADSWRSAHICRTKAATFHALSRVAGIL